ncbi:MAG TPA: Flp family type IVb pilin [Alphaproteobacteria bacterium]|nr:Flp family type IVb pilin [Alphaproteobacteria bacterium]
MTIRHYLSNLLRDEAGAAGVEYGILVAAIAAGIVVAAFSIGDSVQGAFEYTDGQITSGCGSPCTGS